MLKGVSNVDEGARALAESEEGKREDVGGGGAAGAGAVLASEAVGMLHVELVRPIVVDWNNGRVVIGDKEEEVRKLVETLPKD